MTDDIERTITGVALDEICDPREGDCESVAVALHRVFDADAFVCLYDPGYGDRAIHATVRIDGTLYDGEGATTEEALLDHLSILKPRDFGDGVQSQEELHDHICEDGLVEYDTARDYRGTSPEDMLSYDAELVEKIVALLVTEV